MPMHKGLRVRCRHTRSTDVDAALSQCRWWVAKLTRTLRPEGAGASPPLVSECTVNNLSLCGTTRL